MKIQYYEVFDRNLDKYVYYRKTVNSMTDFDFALSYRSDRIWKWDPQSEEVAYVKNRRTCDNISVNLKEFFMLQLRAQDL